MANIKELKDLLKLLRSQGVLQYQTQELNLVLSETLPEPPKKAKEVEETEDRELTPEEEAERILFWSATPVPDSTPEN